MADGPPYDKPDAARGAEHPVDAAAGPQAVVEVHRSAALAWSPSRGETVRVHSRNELAAQVSAWRTYGDVVKVSPHGVDRREAYITGMGEDGWLVKLRDAHMVKRGWPYSKRLTRVMPAEKQSTRASRSQWYLPDPTTDLAGTFLLAEQIQFVAADVAGCAWAWLTAGPLPVGFDVGIPGPDHVACDSVVDALDWIATSDERPWTRQGGQAAIELAEDLGVDRVIVTSPGQIAVRAPASDRRILFQRRGEGADEHVRVIGMVDELGREYTMRLPSREIIRISRRRRHLGRG